MEKVDAAEYYSEKEQQLRAEVRIRRMVFIRHLANNIFPGGEGDRAGQAQPSGDGLRHLRLHQPQQESAGRPQERSLVAVLVQIDPPLVSAITEP